MHFVKATFYVFLGFCVWLTSYILGVFLVLGLAIYGIGIALKMEKDDG